MDEKLSIQIWVWYLADEFKPVLELCVLCQALEFLSLEAVEQSSTIAYCPACEVWSDMMLPLNNFLENFPERLTQEMRIKIERLWNICNELSEVAFHCDDYEIFHNQEWNQVRSEAREILSVVDWQNVKNDADDLMLKCRMSLYPYMYKH
ncbi:hypothetical protein [Iodobacter fluviatilis]|uniref:Uncharacterized protein n=1 Tax=Iodobacter fluviatilis TaxID=537 RepID=A0A377Q224_9NEIS|nr:hypothetical protein [Iodobacter fluviatilis]TCU90279.1 hypothetical protein EV682_101304 [Iodobacter fluviatilis]STQ89306.1 Uncharacterised protein [Iodobacter fluviatilis]